MADDPILYQNPTVTITQQRALMDGNSYLIRDLLSVSVRRARNPSTLVGLALLSIGIGIWVLGLLFWYYGGSSLLQPFLLGLIFLSLGLWQRRETGGRPRYILQLIDTRGKSTALTSTSQTYLEEVAQALQRALDLGQDPTLSETPGDEHRDSDHL